MKHISQSIRLTCVRRFAVVTLFGLMVCMIQKQSHAQTSATFSMDDPPASTETDKANTGRAADIDFDEKPTILWKYAEEC
jgi:hypothetical protein